MRIAMVSEHASPLAVLGGVDAGGQNVHVAALATALGAARRRGRRAHAARRSASCRGASRSRRGVEVDHVDAGPPARGAQGRAAAVHGRVRRRPARAVGRTTRPTSCTRTSGCPASPRSTRRDDLGDPGRAHVPRARDGQAPPPGRPRTPARRGRIALERASRARSTASSPPAPTRSSSCCGWAPTGAGSPSCRAASTSSASRRTGPAEPRGATGRRLVAACRLVERKGIADAVDRARRRCPDAELHVAGGPEAAALDADPEARRLRALAAAARRRRPARAARARRARRDAARCCAPPTPSCACRGTSRSASCRWRRWPAACRSSRPPSAARSTPSSTA